MGGKRRRQLVRSIGGQASWVSLGEVRSGEFFSYASGRIPYSSPNALADASKSAGENGRLEAAIILVFRDTARQVRPHKKVGPGQLCERSGPNFQRVIAAAFLPEAFGRGPL